MATGIFRGWWIAAACGLGLGCGIATLVASTFGVYLGPLRAEFGWQASDAFIATLIVTTVTAILAPLVGTVVDHLGPRRVIIASFVAVVAILASFGFQGRSLGSFYLRYALLGTVGLGTTHVAFAPVIALWFDRRRGLALGVALAGIGLGGFLWPIFCQFAIQHVGWRNAYFAQALLIGGLALPVVALVIRDSPASVGLEPDGDASAGTTAQAARLARTTFAGPSLRGAAHQPLYWLMLVAFFVIGLGVQSLMLHLVPLLTGRGLSPMLAALGQSLLFLALVFGRLASGWLLDRYFAPRVAIGFLIAPIVGIVLLALGAGGLGAIAAALLVGLAAGGEVDVLAYLTSRYFGLRHYSAIYGSLYGLYSLGGGLGGPLTARLAAGPAGYAPALWMNAGLLVAACALLLRLGPFPQWAPRPAAA